MNFKTFALILVCTAFASESAFAQVRNREVLRARRPIAGQYVVVLAGNDDPEAVGRESESLYRGRLNRIYQHTLHGFAIRLTPAAAAALARDPRVAYVEEDGVVQISGTETPTPSWGLDRIDQRSLPLDGAFTYGPAGTTVHVHIIDTGIRVSHVEFGGRASIAGDFVDDDNNPLTPPGNDDAIPGTPDGADCNGHGTHVAGTIGGLTYGVAKNAILHAYRALDCSGNGTSSGVIAAIDAVAADGRRPAVANMSLGGGLSPSLDDAVQRAIAAGITFVVAAGNGAVDARGSSPADVAEAITVGATDSSDVRANFSNYGPVLDLFAPGVNITSAWYTSDTAAAGISGTSMASPHVAGVAALYLEKVGDKSPQEVRDAIVSAATNGVVVGGGAGSPNRLLYSGFTLPGGGNQPPTVTMTSPADGATFVAPATIALSANAADSDGTVSQVAFYANGFPIGTDLTAPYSISWSPVPAGTYALTAVATDNGLFPTTSAAVTVTVTGAGGGPSVTFVGTDTTTQGSWKNVYGTQGYVVVNDGTSLPPGATVAPTGQTSHTWAASTTDSRALQKALIADRLAATWYAGNSFTIDVDAGDGQAHRVGLYLLDWDNAGRGERVEVLNPITGGVLDTRTVTAFSAGQYWTWRITGFVRFRITLMAGANVVMSGVFLDPANGNLAPTVSITSPANDATFVAPATTTVSANAADPDGTVSQVAFYANGSLIGTDLTAPYSVPWNNVAAGAYTLTAVATDNSTTSTTSAGVTVTVNVAGGGGGPTVAFVGTDATTQGSWKNVYGTQGYVVVNDGTSLPPGATVTPTGHASHTWAASTIDSRALQKALIADRLAATWYAGNSFTVDVDAGDGQAHRVGLYMLDWDNAGRGERVEVLNPITGGVLDTRTVTAFSAGQYWTWRITGAVRFRVTLMAGANVVMSGVFLDPANGNVPPTVSITSPANGATFVAPATTTISADAADPDGTVSQVAFYANGSLIGTDLTAPYSVPWNSVAAGAYTLTAVATDNSTTSTTSAGVMVTVNAAGGGGGPTVAFVGTDTTTQGSWKNVYGTQGYVVVNDGTSLPPGATVAPAGHASHTWVASTTDNRALQKALIADRLASTWYAGGSFTVDVDAGDGQAHRVGLYMLDWDYAGRAERVEVLNPITGAVLDTRTVTAFSAGQYWTWRITGAVRFRITLTGGGNAVMSGVFLDP